MTRLSGLAFAALCALVVAPAPASAYDAEAGKAKAKACAACHGPDGNSKNPAYPSLAGQRERYIILSLFQFRGGARPSPQMAPLAKNLTDDDLGNLAAYYSAQKPWTPARKTSEAAAAAGADLVQQRNCVQCHAAGLVGQEHIPRIAGQKIDFIKAQLKAFKAGKRGDIDGLMTSAMQEVSDADIATLADYISGLGPP